jgi:hypothetical protein
MKKLIMLFFVIAAGLLFATPGQSQTITIGSFDNTRSRAPFATEVGALGYDHIRSSLQNPANFGPSGIVRCSVVIAPGTPTLTAAYLADKNILFTSVFTGDLSASEAMAVRDFVARGGCVIVDANSDPAEQTAATSLLAAIGTSAATGPGTICFGPGTITSSLNPITNGPFGNVAGGSFGTTLTAIITLDGRDVSLVTCSGGIGRAAFLPGAISPGSGLVMYGGDPSAFNLFTQPGEGAFDPNNEVIYLNAIAGCCGSNFDVCLQDDSNGNLLQFNSTTGAYLFTNCAGLTLSGTGSVTIKGGVITLQQNGPDRRVLGRIDRSMNRGAASVQIFPPGSTFTITDRNTANNTCACPAALGQPTQLSPPDGSVFNNFPRTTTLTWTAVPGAASYTVEIDCFHCCQSGFWCTDIGQAFRIQTGIPTASFTFNFVGAQPGRWRVWAVGPNGEQSPKTGWWVFSYTV